MLHYTWPFNSSHPALAGAASGAASDGGASLGSLATALSSVITSDTIGQAIIVPNLPPEVPPDFSPATSKPAGLRGRPIPRPLICLPRGCGVLVLAEARPRQSVP